MEKSMLVICESGISATLLVSKLLETVRDRGLSYDIDYAPMRRVQEKLAHRDYDTLLLTPQVAGYEEKLTDIIEDEKCHSKIVFIDQEDFQYMNTESILESTLE